MFGQLDLDTVEKHFSIAGAVLIPIAIALFGYCASNAEVERRKADRLMPFVTNFSSKNEEEKKNAAKLFNYYSKKGLLPNDAAPLFVIVATDKNPEVAKEGQEAIVIAGEKDKKLAQEIGDVIGNSDQETKEKIVEATTENPELKKTLIDTIDNNDEIVKNIEEAKPKPNEQIRAEESQDLPNTNGSSKNKLGQQQP